MSNIDDIERELDRELGISPIQPSQVAHYRDNQLYRSYYDRRLGGVIGGLAEKLDIDPTLLRILYGASAIFAWPILILIYMICWMAIPKETKQQADARLLGRVSS